MCKIMFPGIWHAHTQTQKYEYEYEFEHERCQKVPKSADAESCSKVPKGADAEKCRKVPKVKHMFLSLGATHFGELFTLGLIHLAQYTRLTKGDKVKHMYLSLGENTLESCSLWD